MDPDGYIGYLDAYDRLFPDHRRSEADKEKADKAFSKFRRTLHEIAADHQVRLELRLDDRRSADLASRRFRFARRTTPASGSSSTAAPPPRPSRISPSRRTSGLRSRGLD